MKRILLLGALLLSAHAWALTPTDTPSDTPTFSATASPTSTATNTPTFSASPTPTATPTYCGVAPSIVGNAITSDTGVPATSYTVSYTAPSGTNRVLIVNVELYALVQPTVSSITYNGTPMTFLTGGDGLPNVPSGTDTDIETWYLMNPSTTSGAGLVITASGKSTYEIAALTIQGASGVVERLTDSSITSTSSYGFTIAPDGNSSLFEGFFQLGGPSISSGTPYTQKIYVDPNYNVQPIVGALTVGSTGGNNETFTYNFNATVSEGYLQFIEILASSGCNTMTPTPTYTASPTPTNTPVNTATVTPSATPTNSPSFSPSPTASMSPTPGPLQYSGTGIYQSDYAPLLQYNSTLSALTSWQPMPVSCTGEPCIAYLSNPDLTPGHVENYDFEPTMTVTPQWTGNLNPGAVVKIYLNPGDQFFGKAAVTAQVPSTLKMENNK